MNFLNKNMNLLLTGVSIVLLIVGFWVNDPFAWFEYSYEKADKLLAGIDKSNINIIETSKNKAVKLLFKKSEEGWNVRKPDQVEPKSGFLADKDIIDNAITNLFSIRKYQEVSSNKERFKNFEVDENSFHVTLKSSDSKVLADVYLGKEGATLNSSFVRLGKENTVYSAKGNFKSDWGQDLNHFRDKSLFSFIGEDIASLSISGKYNYSLEKDKDLKWKLKQRGKSDLPAKISKMQSTFSEVAKLKASSFHESDSVAGIPNYATALIKLISQKEVTLGIFGPNKEDKYIAKTSESPYLFVLPKWKVENAIIDPTSLEEKKSKDKNKSNRNKK